MYKVYDVNMEDMHVQSHAEGDRVHLLPIILLYHYLWHSDMSVNFWGWVSTGDAPNGIWDTGYELIYTWT